MVTDLSKKYHIVGSVGDGTDIRFEHLKHVILYLKADVNLFQYIDFCSHNIQ
jgi:hypothetical protein